MAKKKNVDMPEVDFEDLSQPGLYYFIDSGFAHGQSWADAVDMMKRLNAVQLDMGCDPTGCVGSFTHAGRLIYVIPVPPGVRTGYFGEDMQFNVPSGVMLVVPDECMQRNLATPAVARLKFILAVIDHEFEPELVDDEIRFGPDVMVFMR
jgi:hypothetical protein